MTRFTTALLSSAMLLAVSGHSFADDHGSGEHADKMGTHSCVNPSTAPIIPDGNVASLDELIAAQNSVKAYQAELIEYRECLNEAMVAEATEEQDIQKNAALNAAYDASIDAETKVVAEFSTARIAYQARQPKDK